MTTEHDDSLNRAAAIIHKRICGLPEFAAARGMVVAVTLAECRGRDVSAMRELGGFSAVLERNIDALPDKFRLNYGSKLLRRSVVDTLRAFVPSMREEVQAQLAREARAV